MNLKNITADKLVALYKNKDLSVSEVISGTYEEIVHTEKEIHAFISRLTTPADGASQRNRKGCRLAAGTIHERLEPVEEMAQAPQREPP